jgi:ribulose-5-phosphate 4-epimerase/fuculose-1-phosphate aldolase
VGDDGSPELYQLRREVALACRMLALTGLTTPILGHVSIRLDPSRVLVRCRGPEERGLLATEVSDVRLVHIDDRGAVAGGYTLPNEFPIHAEILRARPDADSVVHAHPRSALLAGLADIALRPVFGAYNIPAAAMATAGVPVFEHRGLVRSPERGRELAATLGDSSVALLRGHGIVTAGDRVVQAVVRAFDLDDLLSISVELARLGAEPDEVSESDRADLPDLGGTFNEDAVWRYRILELARAGLDDVSQPGQGGHHVDA